MVNGVQLFFGKLEQNSSFWIDGDQNHCSVKFMSTRHITIQNGTVISSRCKGLYNFLDFNQRVTACFLDYCLTIRSARDNNCANSKYKGPFQSDYISILSKYFLR